MAARPRRDIKLNPEGAYFRAQREKALATAAKARATRLFNLATQFSQAVTDGRISDAQKTSLDAAWQAQDEPYQAMVAIENDEFPVPVGSTRAAEYVKYFKLYQAALSNHSLMLYRLVTGAKKAAATGGAAAGAATGGAATGGGGSDDTEMGGVTTSAEEEVVIKQEADEAVSELEKAFSMFEMIGGYRRHRRTHRKSHRRTHRKVHRKGRGHSRRYRKSN